MHHRNSSKSHNQRMMSPTGLTNILLHCIIMVSGQRLLQLIVVVSIISSTHALLGSEAEAARFNNQLLYQDQPPTKLDSRLETLLQLKKSISDLVQSSDDATSGPSFDKKNIVSEKRVFCNGFTGCGGKLRGILGQQLALEDMRKRMQKAKRPFCKTKKCFNSVKQKKRGNGARDSSLSTSRFNNFVNEDVSNANSGTNSVLSPENSREKKLFCNHYGGCRNMGKRGGGGFLLPVLVGDSSAYGYPLEDRKHPFDIAIEHNKAKRFFASSYDASMDDFVDDL